jgi:hypothetical protein
MNRQQITKAYAEWCCSIQPDFYFVLNYQSHLCTAPLTYEQLSSQVKTLFYRLECDEWGYEQRESRWGRRFSRIERIVCIEKASAYHANVMMKRYGSTSDAQLLEHVKRTWLDIQHRSCEWNDDYLFQSRNNGIKSHEAVSLYSNKDTAKANQRNEDVLCLRASFISKHSNRR